MQNMKLQSPNFIQRLKLKKKYSRNFATKYENLVAKLNNHIAISKLTTWLSVQGGSDAVVCLETSRSA